MEFTQSQLSLMGEEDKAGIEQARKNGFHMPGYMRLSPHPVSGEIRAIKQLFSPTALRIVSGKRYPESATPENCERLLTIWNANGSGHYAML